MKKIYVLILILCLSITIVGCSKVETQDSGAVKKANQVSQVSEDEDSQAANNYVKQINYKVAVNSGACQKILLPGTFEDEFNNFDIGSFLKEKNEESKKNGLDFKDYLGKQVLLYSYASEIQEGDLVLLILNGKVIGAWKDDKMKDPEEESDYFHVILENTKNVT
jgi:hypothetical protein